MEISRDALLRIIKATRYARKMSLLMNGMLLSNHRTIADEVNDQLTDFLYEFSGENISRKIDNIYDSDTYYLIVSMKSNEEVTDEFVRMHAENFGRQPAPYTIEPEKMKELVSKNGGYFFETPEGGWK